MVGCVLEGQDDRAPYASPRDPRARSFDLATGPQILAPMSGRTGVRFLMRLYVVRDIFDCRSNDPDSDEPLILARHGRVTERVFVCVELAKTKRYLYI